MPINPHYQDNTRKFVDKPRPDAPRPGDFPEGNPQPDDNPQKDNPYAEKDPKKKPEDNPERNPGYDDNDRENLA